MGLVGPFQGVEGKEGLELAVLSSRLEGDVEAQVKEAKVEVRGEVPTVEEVWPHSGPLRRKRQNFGVERVDREVRLRR